MHIYLLRHGDALDNGYTESERPLSPLGEKQAHRVADFFAESNIYPGIVFASPLVRALQMATIVCAHLRLPPPETSEYLVPESNERQMMSQLNTLAPSSVLLVGHEPHLRSFITALIREQLFRTVVLPKAALAKLEVDHPIERGKGVLHWVKTTERMGRESGD